MKLLKTIPKKMRTSFIKISSRLPNSIQLTLYRSLTNIPETLPPGFKFKIASTKQEFIEATKLVHDEYLKLNLIERQQSGLRLNPYLTVPTTSILIVKHNIRVVGTVSLIRDNPIGLPMDKIFKLDELRSLGDRLCEISGFAVADPYKGDKMVSSFLLKYLIHFVSKNQGIDRLVIAVHPKATLYYKSLGNFIEMSQDLAVKNSYMNGAPAKPLMVTRDGIVNSFGGQLINDETRVLYNQSEIQYPYYHLECQVLSSQTLHELVTQDNSFFSKLSNEDLFKLHQTFDKSPLASILPHFQKGEADNFQAERKRRFFVDCDTQLYVGEKIVPAVTYNVSNRGCLIKANSKLEIGQTFLVKINIGESKNILAFAKTIWSHQNGLTGLRLQSFSKRQDWNEYIKYLSERVLAGSIRSTETSDRGLA